MGINEYCPLLGLQIIGNAIIKLNKIDALDFAINSINQGDYVNIYLNNYYIPHRVAYQKEHSVREHLLYGYDLEKRIFYAVGFNEKLIYSNSEISFSNFKSGFNETDEKMPLNLLKFNETEKYMFDIENVKQLLTDYLYSNDTSKRVRMYKNPNPKKLYGMKVYDGLKLYLDNLEKEKIPIDLKPFHILLEHKRCMVSRIKYMFENKYILTLNPFHDVYIDIEKKAQILLNLLIRYSMTGDTALIKSSIVALDEMAEKERHILVNLLQCLD